MSFGWNKDKDKDKDDKKKQKEGGRQRKLDEFFSTSRAGTEGSRTARSDRYDHQSHRTEKEHDRSRKDPRDRREKDPHDVHSEARHESFQDEEYLELPPPEAEEALCMHCGDVNRIIYIDPKTRKPYPQKFAKRPEICDHCGQIWPRNKPYSERMKRQIQDRLRHSRYNKKFSCGCDVVEPRLDGKKKALLIGINYYEQSHPLKGCRGDVTRMQKFLKDRYGFTDMLILTEYWQEHRHPTREEIIKGMKWLVQDASPGDSLFLHYSGHGGQTRDFGFDEPDGKDEGIYPVDYHLEGSKGILTDDDMHRILTDIPEGVQLTALFDSCHSGSVLDLPYEMNRTKHQLTKANARYKREKKNGGRVILWSGCLDKQTSADATIEGRPTGAMSYPTVRLPFPPFTFLMK
ncbi:hypothetical protein ACEPAH_2791 [Sanghuangporus vaninii]